MRTLDELIERREDCKYGDSVQFKRAIDDSILERAKETERRLKRLAMAKYSLDLFDEIIEEMIKEKRSQMEMMAELDVDDQAIADA